MRLKTKKILILIEGSVEDIGVLNKKIKNIELKNGLKLTVIQ